MFQQALCEMSRLPAGSLIVVSGANGYVGSHIVDQLLQAGFNVRGTVRDLSKASWLIEYVEDTYGAERLDLVVVPDLAAEGAFDGATKGRQY